MSADMSDSVKQKKTYPLPPVFIGVFISFAGYQRLMVSAMNID